MRLLAAMIGLLCLAVPALAAPKYPALAGRVTDAAHILDAATIAGLDGKLAALEAKTSRQLVVVTVPSLQGYDIADFGYQLGRDWGIGQSKFNNGVMLIVAPTERKVRIEVGYGLEPMLTDALSSVIIQKSILPRFRKSDFNGGVTQGVDALVQQLSLDPTAAEKKVAAAEAQAQAAGEDDGGWWPFLIFLGLAGFYLFVLRRIWPFTLLASGGWSSGGFGGSSFGGGGGVFSGGGGSFGGGGASGSW